MKHSQKFAQDTEHNASALTSDGCMARRDDPSVFRDLELADADHEKTFGMSAEAEERRIMNYVAILNQHGKQPLANETLTDFIVRNMETIRSVS